MACWAEKNKKEQFIQSKQQKTEIRDKTWRNPGIEQVLYFPEVKALRELHPRKLTWIPKMMVWKRWFLLNMAIFGIYVGFLGGNYCSSIHQR